jgi:hypothetical protein
MFRFLVVQFSRFTCADSHFDIRRPAECPACDGNGKGKQCHKGKGKEKVGGFQITPLSIMKSACKPSNLASCFAVITPP